jgi:hypothetical protein
MDNNNNFLPYASKMRLLSDSLLVVQVHPLVTKEQRNEWEKYAIHELEQGMLEETVVNEVRLFCSLGVMLATIQS